MVKERSKMRALLTVLVFLCPIIALAQPGGGLPATSAITGGTINGATVGATTPSTGAFTALSATTMATTTNCSSGASPAVCGAAAAGSAAVPTGSNPTLQINTTAVTANSQIMVTPDETLGTKLTVTCNTTITTVGPIAVTARTPGSSFTVQVDATVAVNPVCLSYLIVN